MNFSFTKKKPKSRHLVTLGSLVDPLEAWRGLSRTGYRGSLSELLQEDGHQESQHDPQREDERYHHRVHVRPSLGVRRRQGPQR